MRKSGGGGDGYPVEGSLRDCDGDDDDEDGHERPSVDN